MIETALTIIVVVMAALGMGLHFCLMRAQRLVKKQRERADGLKRELDEEAASAGQLLMQKNDFIGEMHLKMQEYCMARNVAESQASAAWDQARNFEARYHAALRALRIRQAVIDGLARERDGATAFAAAYLDQCHEHRRNNEAYRKTAEDGYQRIRAEVKRLEASIASWRQTAEDVAKQRDRLAAQLKKLKARSK